MHHGLMSSQMTRDTGMHSGARWFFIFYVKDSQRVQSSGENDIIKAMECCYFKNNVITSVCYMLCWYLKTSLVSHCPRQIY